MHYIVAPHATGGKSGKGVRGSGLGDWSWGIGVGGLGIGEI